ncbi:TonB-dependent siderophore receptor [Janthinobacterium tructae]|uniref:TonB-dependent siderophore receptor n=1 Tax=Janthinobacterium tructae TaxID=2590869 RepID=A0A4Y6RFD3_9BURK|nr:TonB-dependent receptor [Janthinobacterium tructae]QDG71306.1 TonB-dependent siderophore receptor [Janthinobacterium tructae]
MHPPRLTPLARAIGSAVILLSLAQAPAMAAASATAPASTQISFSVPPGELSAAIASFAIEAKVSVGAAAELLQGVRTPGLSGSYTVPQALARLLAGTGLDALPSGERSYVLRKSGAASTAAPIAATLDEVAVNSSALRDGTTEGKRGYAGLTSATRLNLSLRETPQAVSVITRQQIDDQGLRTLQDVLLQAPGITVDHSSSTREYDQVFSRGFEVTSYMFDGIPTSKNLEARTYDMAIYDRVEIIRGATGLISGTGSPSAAVNLVRKRPGRGFAATAGAQLGSWDRYRIEGDVSTPLTADGKVRARIVAAHEDQRSFIDRYQQKKDVLYAIVETDLTPSTVLSAGINSQKEKLKGAGRDFPMFYADGSQTRFPRSMNGTAAWSTYEREQSMLFATLDHYFENDWIAKLAVSRSSNQYDALQGFSGNGYPDRVTGGGMRLWLANWHSKPQQTSLDAYVSGPFQAFGRQHELVLGVSASELKTNSPIYPGWRLDGYDYTVPDIHAWNGDMPVPDYSGTRLGSSYDKERESGLYSTLRLRPTDALSVIIGARLSYWKRDIRSDYVNDTDLYDAMRENGKITPYAGLVYDLGRHWSAYASYTSIFTPQSQRDVNSRFLAPLEGKNYEVGAKGEFFGGKLTTSAALFHLKQENLAEADPGNVWIIGTGGGSYAYHTVKGATTRGVEAEVSGQLRPNWQLTASYAYSRIRNAAGERIQTNQPQAMAKLWSTWRLAQGVPGLVLGGGVNWQSNIYMDDRGPNGERFTQKAYAVAGLMAQYQLSAQLLATLNVNNVFDKRYYSTGMGGYYGDPRNAMLSLRYQF